MSLIWMFMALAIVALGFGSALVGLVIHLVLRRTISSRRRSLFISVMIGWALNAVLLWNPFPLDMSKAWLLGLGLALALGLTLPFVKPSEK